MSHSTTGGPEIVSTSYRAVVVGADGAPLIYSRSSPDRQAAYLAAVDFASRVARAGQRVYVEAVYIGRLVEVGRDV